MDSSYTLLALPQPLDSTNGKVQSSVVISLQGSRKRKRDELVVGVDGEAINIYEIQKQSIQTSYAIPPSAYLCSPPISVHTHGEQGAQRDTFAVLRDGPEDRKRRLVRFQERYSGSAEFMAPSKKEFALPPGDICSIHALPSQTLGASFAPQSLVAYTNGDVLCVAEDMSKTAWRTSLLEGESGTIEAVFLDDVGSAQRGILRSREDIAATLPFEDKLTTVACFVIRQADATILRLCSVDSGSSRGGLRQLGDVPLRTTAPSGASKWELSMETGQLCQLHNGILHIFDLTGITPRLSLTISEKTNRFNAVKHISKSLVLALSAHRATLYDSQYGSIQGVVALSTNTASTTSRKRKREGAAAARRPDLHWLGDLRTAIVSSSTLVGIPLKAELALSAKESIQLASVIGKSATAQADEELENEESEAWRQQVESYVAAEDAVGLEAAVASSFGIDIGLPLSPEAMTDEPAETLWDLDSEPLSLGVNQKARALEVLQRLFALSGNTALRLRLISRNLIRWLFAVELVTSTKLSSIYSSDISMRQVAQALVDADPTFQLAYDVLTLGVHLPVEFSVACLQLLIRSLDTVPNVNGAASVNGDDEIDHEAQAAEAELSNALLTLQSGLEIRSATMQLLFGRLHAFSRKVLTKALKTGLELRDLVFFVHLLRIELADAGWTRSYINDIEDSIDDEATPFNGAIRTIGNLMVAAVDAMGPAGWLVGLTTDEDEQVGLIDALRAEIGASLEGVYEAQLLKATLDDFGRFALLKKEPETTSRPRIEVQGTAEETSYMPMGGRSSVVASQRKHAVKRKDEMVGAYQFERIRV